MNKVYILKYIIQMYGILANKVLIPTSEMGNDVIYRLFFYFNITLYGSYCDRICSIKFILSH